MKASPELREQIFDVIQNQITSNRPPETRLTYERLLALGFTAFEAKQLIGQCVALEIFLVLKEQQPFNEARYIRHLQQLPKEPSE